MKIRSLLILIILTSCSKKEVVDKFIEKYDQIAFSDFDNLCVSRIDNSFEINECYLINSSYEKMYYIVNYRNGKIINIEKKNFDEKKEFLSTKQIYLLVKKMDDNDFMSVCSDSIGIRINPFSKRANAYFLRLHQSHNIDSIIRGYRHYKDNWYVDIDSFKDIE